MRTMTSNSLVFCFNEEKSPHLLSHRGFKDFQLISESPMMISGEDIRVLDVPSYQNVWVLVDLPKGHRAIGTKWVYRNKKDEMGIVIRNKARLVAQGHTQEEGIDC
ncbi:putative ribonuclease H-like domain-containing protein [Tanacetum coccineum]